MKSILVTGGTGYIGGRLCEYLSKFDKFKIYVATRRMKIYESLNIQFVHIDWDDDLSITNVCKKMDVIIHLAGLNSKDSNSDLDYAVKVNVGNTIKLLNSVKKTSVKKFIYISTIHVYGDILKNKITEKSKLNPRNNYALTRIMAENEIKQFSLKNEFTTIVIRLSNAFGKPHKKNVNCWNLLFNDLCRQLVTKKKITLKSNGQQYRNFITLSDLCRAMHFIIKKEKFDNYFNLFNLGSDFTAKVFDIAKLVMKRYEEIFKTKNLKIKFKVEVNQIQSNFFNYDTSKFNKDCNILKFDTKSEIDNLIKFCFKNF